VLCTSSLGVYEVADLGFKARHESGFHFRGFGVHKNKQSFWSAVLSNDTIDRSYCLNPVESWSCSLSKSLGSEMVGRIHFYVGS
jgi:hypothetical protein